MTTGTNKSRRSDSEDGRAHVFMHYEQVPKSLQFVEPDGQSANVLHPQ